MCSVRMWFGLGWGKGWVWGTDGWGSGIGEDCVGVSVLFLRLCVCLFLMSFRIT